ncbi:LacI family DNA-binding transcriptional regulator [Ponticoccus litoralis]|uniref:LacI family DNA-binding transcriptional regulator n=1 Tax=Ponticoccus litoralis TaxID=422297 RepID=A0AAW9SSP6_9RHOB
MEEIGKQRGKPTLRTVADATGFAVTTVSRALSGDPKIAPATRQKVAEAARRLGYVPDRAAQRLRTGRTKVITLLINPDHEFLGFLSQIQTGIVEALRGTGYSVTLMPDFIADDRIAVIENILRNRLADGIILSRTECFDPRVRLLLERGFPFVSHGRTEFTAPHPYVDFDNESFARQAVQRLVAKGRRRLMIVLPEKQFTFAQHLRYGFLSAVREAGVDHVIAGDLTLETPPGKLAASLLEIQRGPTPPDGHICVGEVMGIATLSHRAGRGTGAGARRGYRGQAGLADLRTDAPARRHHRRGSDRDRTAAGRDDAAPPAGRSAGRASSPDPAGPDRTGKTAHPAGLNGARRRFVRRTGRGLSARCPHHTRLGLHTRHLRHTGRRHTGRYRLRGHRPHTTPSRRLPPTNLCPRPLRLRRAARHQRHPEGQATQALRKAPSGAPGPGRERPPHLSRPS